MTITDTSYLPQVCNTGIVKGSDRILAFSFVVDEEPYDLTGTQPKITITTRTGVVVAEYTLSSGLAINENVLIWSITKAQSAGIAIGNYNYRVILQIEDEYRPYIYGSYKVVVR